MLYDLIPEEKKSIYLKDLLEYIVDRNGLASIPKSDIEACFIFLYKKHVDKDCDLYTLSNLFKIKESKLKSLLELFCLKFDLDNKDDDNTILDLLLESKFQIESMEKVEINFHFSKIEYYPLFQKYFRKANSAVKFDKNSESIIVNQNRLYDVLDIIWKNHENEQILEGNPKSKIQIIIGNLGNSIDEELRKNLREKKKSELFKAIEYASKLTGIGSFVLNLYKADPFKIIQT